MTAEHDVASLQPVRIPIRPALALLGCLLAFPPAAQAAGMSAVKHVEVDGMSVGYREGGRGPNLVLVMGRTGTMADWDPALLRRLIFGHHLVVFDNRGVATTDNPSSETLTVARMAEDTLGLMSALGIKRTDLMGWSMGGYIAQQVTIDAPSRVRRLVLCATSPGGSHTRAPRSEVVQKALANPELSSAVLFELSFPFDRTGRRGKARYLYRVARQPDLEPDSLTVSDATREQQLKATSQWKSASGGSYEELPEINQRTLVLWGNQDQVEPPANDRLLVRRLPDSNAHVYTDAGHAFLFEYPFAVGWAIRNFLR